MNIYLGNLSIESIENRMGITFPQELRDYMVDKHQDNAGTLAPQTWHCFDMPFLIKCFDIGMAQKIYDHLSPLQGQMKEPLQIAIQEAVK